MTRKKMLKMKPFNEFYHKSCYYNSILSAVLYLGGSIEPLLCNDFFYYCNEFDEENPGIHLQYKSKVIKEEAQLLKLMGISFENIEYEQIWDMLDHGIPVHIRIDRRYWGSPRNNSIFDSVAMAHNYMITGYDRDKDEFLVIDSTPGQNVLSKVSCSMMNSGMREYKKLNKKHGIVAIRAMERGARAEDYKKMFHHRFDEFRGVMHQGIEELPLVRQTYAVMESELWQRAALSDITLNIDRIKTSRELEAYRVERFYDGMTGEYTLKTQKAVDILGVIQSLFTKISMRGTVSDTVRKSVCGMFQQLYLQENDCFNTLACIIDRNR
ncbi:hypothetical protein [Clostridium sp. E02]|uniref:hypothetical protein n=1 Tax=Clostridium sp. E02 TaxID=2487134 RepID=UPI000F5457E0|nr:hypothetical protein [Clostridium sp. E02]